MEAKIIYETQRENVPASGECPAYQRFYQIAEVDNGRKRYIFSTAKVYENESDRENDTVSGDSGDITTNMFVFISKDRLIEAADLLMTDRKAGRKLLSKLTVENSRLIEKMEEGN